MKKLLLFISIFFLGINYVNALEKVEFSKCVDGDTFRIIIDNEEKLVRMLAVDTPELAKQDKKADYYANEASEYTCKRVSNAKKIELEYDNKSDKYDKYDRLLAWVYVDGKLLQSELVEKGYAKIAYLYDEYKYVELLKEKQEIASAKEIGVWNDSAKEKYENGEDTEDNYMNLEIIIITVIFMILTFIFKIITKK